ncbi:DUF4817 domain-containing protein [Trichonephila clavipes]|nr:DUF4817 domain-containing protein [Trichonephila clavipes]
MTVPGESPTAVTNWKGRVRPSGGLFTETQSTYLIGLESAEGYPLTVNDIPKRGKFPKNTPYHDVFMGAMPSSRRGNASPFSVGLESHHHGVADRCVTRQYRQLNSILPPHLLSSHHWWRRRMWFCVKGRPSNGLLTDRPLCYKRRRMHLGDTFSYVTAFHLLSGTSEIANLEEWDSIPQRFMGNLITSIQNSCQVIFSQFALAIHQNDHQARRRFVEWAQNEITVVSDFHNRILFSDEAHFWLNGYVNKQNCRIWSEANPQVYVKTPLHPENLTVWRALWAGGIIGPYFFKNDEGHNVTVNGDRYRAMITNFFIPELNNHHVQELWFQQDGATCHTARATIDLLKDTFGDHLISRFGPVNWPPRSFDLTPLDYFLWGYIKSLVYADKPQTLDHLEDNIRRVIVDVRPQMLEKVIENWTSGLGYIRASCGSHMPEIIF